MLQTVVQSTAFPLNASPNPGPYPGSGKAALLRPGQYLYLLQNTSIIAPQASIAFQIERTKSGFFYPIGFSLEISFSANPGVFEVDLQTSDTDQDGFFCKNTIINGGLNSNNVGRIEMTNYWALFGRVYVATLTNPVLVTVKATR
jgi:hypothetical protein